MTTKRQEKDHEEEEEDDWGTWEEDEETSEYVDLFSLRTFSTIQELFSYCAETYGFDVAAIRRDLSLDIYGSIKLINFARATTKTSGLTGSDAATNVQNRIRENPLCFKNGEEYLRPVMEDDAVLRALGTAFEGNEEDGDWSTDEESPSSTFPETGTTRAHSSKLHAENEMLKENFATRSDFCSA